MRDRFTRKGQIGRGAIPKRMKEDVFERDGYTCQFCGAEIERGEATIDHLIASLVLQTHPDERDDPFCIG